MPQASHRSIEEKKNFLIKKKKRKRIKRKFECKCTQYRSFKDRWKKHWRSREGKKKQELINKNGKSLKSFVAEHQFSSGKNRWVDGNKRGSDLASGKRFVQADVMWLFLSHLAARGRRKGPQLSVCVAGISSLFKFSQFERFFFFLSPFLALPF